MKPTAIGPALLSVLLFSSACATAPRTPPEPSLAPSRAIHWVRSSAEFRAVTRQTYRLATRALERLAAGHERGTWAVALDGDETVFDNSLYQKERMALGLDYTLDTWHEWCARRQAGVVPGAKEFLRRVRELGGKIAIVSNRSVLVQEHTEENLKSLRIPFDLVLLKDKNSQKEPRWKRIEDGTAAPNLPPLKILLWVGDNVGDFPELDQSLRTKGSAAYGAFGDRFWMLPNPMYGSWVRNPSE